MQGRSPFLGWGPRRDSGAASPSHPYTGDGQLSRGGAGRRLLALVGPTASGKSALAVQVAKTLGDVEIISADSMQVYRGMDIGTAKASRAEREGVAHHLVDVVGPEEEWDVSRFLAAARACVQDIQRRGKTALLVGGTGLYVHALVDDFNLPGRFPAALKDLESLTDADLFAHLRDLDPAAASRLEPGNRRRLVRALEVIGGSGRSFSGTGPGVGAFPPTQWRLAGVWLPRAVVARRIQDRFEAMMAAGLLEEVRGLAGAPSGLSRTARQALGYRELLSHVEKGQSLDQAVPEAVSRTRRFARRQRVWWRRDPRVRWLGAPHEPLALLPALLGEWAE